MNIRIPSQILIAKSKPAKKEKDQGTSQPSNARKLNAKLGLPPDATSEEREEAIYKLKTRQLNVRLGLPQDATSEDQIQRLSEGKG